MNKDASRARTDRLRAIPLHAVLRGVGAQPDPHDKSKWHTAQGLLSVNGMKFINWHQGCGGGGAIDLAMHLTASDFRSALAWLDQRFDSPASLCASTPLPARPLVLPPPDPTQLPEVRRYLLVDRRLPAPLLDPLVQAGQLYADARTNAVFLLLGKEQQPVGAELRGTSRLCWRGLAGGSRKELGYFEVGPPFSRDLILCESAIDAISCAALHPERRCLSTSGARPNPAWLPPLLAQSARIACGFDADPTGDHMAAAMIALYPAISRLRPPLHDWNDILTASA